MSDTPYDTTTGEAAAARFAEMSRKIAHNTANGFSGAIVAFPPGGEPIELLLLANAGDEALFWGTLKGQVEIKLRELAEQQQNRQRGW